jgi:hypothetical protein
VSEAWLAVLVPVGLMAATMGMQHLERRLLGPSPSHDEDAAPRRVARPAPSQPAS